MHINQTSIVSPLEGGQGTEYQAAGLTHFVSFAISSSLVMIL